MNKFKQVISVFGWKGGILLLIYKLFYPRLQAFKSSLILLEWSQRNNAKLSNKKEMVILDGLPDFEGKSFAFRPFTSDSLVLRQHFFYRELEPLVDYFKTRKIIPKLMIDAGGNIGSSACFMHWHFPGLKSLVLEPSNFNCRVARFNLENENSLIWEKALWWRNEVLNFDETRSAWAMRVSNSSSGKKVSGIALSEILQMEEFSSPDYIKIDIEGAEEEVFEKDRLLDNLLHSVACISVEPHSERGKTLIERKLKEWGFRIEYHGELIIGFR